MFCGSKIILDLPYPIPKYFEKYKNGYENGPWIQWYSNGKKEMKMNYVNGVPRGRARFWFPDGSLRGEGIVRNEVPGGGWILMDAEGNKKVYK